MALVPDYGIGPFDILPGGQTARNWLGYGRTAYGYYKQFKKFKKQYDDSRIGSAKKEVKKFMDDRKRKRQDQDLPPRPMYDYPIGPQLAPSLRAQKIYINRCQKEIHTLDTVIGLEAPSAVTNANVKVLNLVREGSAYYERIGSQVFNRSLHIRGTIQVNQQTTPTMRYVRVAVVWDARPSGVAPAISDVFADSNSAKNTDHLSYTDVLQQDRFVVLKDRVWTFMPSGSEQAGGTTDAYVWGNTDFTMNCKLFGRVGTTVFKANGGTIGDISTGALYIMAWGNILTGSAPTIDAAVRLVFTT